MPGRFVHSVTGGLPESEGVGLDYFGARNFSGAQGRFTSLDPTFMTSERMNDPQQWNLYVYTRNNPIRFIDPDGREL
jgi:RHS repeat-associated protein